MAVLLDSSSLSLIEYTAAFLQIVYLNFSPALLYSDIRPSAFQYFSPIEMCKKMFNRSFIVAVLTAGKNIGHVGRKVFTTYF